MIESSTTSSGPELKLANSNNDSNEFATLLHKLFPHGLNLNWNVKFCDPWKHAKEDEDDHDTLSTSTPVPRSVTFDDSSPSSPASSELSTVDEKEESSTLTSTLRDRDMPVEKSPASSPTKTKSYSFGGWGGKMAAVLVVVGAAVVASHHLEWQAPAPASWEVVANHLATHGVAVRESVSSLWLLPFDTSTQKVATDIPETTRMTTKKRRRNKIIKHQK